MFQPKQNMFAQDGYQSPRKVAVRRAPKILKSVLFDGEFRLVRTFSTSANRSWSPDGPNCKTSHIRWSARLKTVRKECGGCVSHSRVGRSCDCQKDWEESKRGVCPFSSLLYGTQTLHQSRSRVENLLAITTNFTFSILTNFTSYKKVDHFPIITIDKTFGPFIEEMWLCTFCVVLRISQFFFVYLLLLYDYCLLSTGLCVKGRSGPTWQLKPKSVPEKDLELWMIQSLRVIENDWDGWFLRKLEVICPECLRILTEWLLYLMDCDISLLIAHIYHLFAFCACHCLNAAQISFPNCVTLLNRWMLQRYISGVQVKQIVPCTTVP